MSWLDLFTTGLALTSPVASEGNVYLTPDGVWDAVRAWAITLIGGLLMIGILFLGARQADAAAEHWLAQSISSFRRLYFNPFAARNADISTETLGRTGAYWLVMSPTFYLITFACAPLAVRTIVWLRRAV